ncbi:MAG: amino acid ABC transporter permease [Collinsella sp.]
MTTVSAGEGPLGRLVSFIRSDHRYVLLGTSAIAAAGMALSASPRPPLSFMARAYMLEVAVYYLLAAWLVLAAIALVFKLARWKAYASASPLHAPGVVARPALRLVCGRRHDRRPRHRPRGLRPRLRPGRSRPRRRRAPPPRSRACSTCSTTVATSSVAGFKTTVALAVFGTVIAFFLALLLVFLRIQVIDRSDNDFVRFWKVVGSGFARTYSTVVRGTPMMVQAMIIFFGVFSLFKMTDLTTTQINAIWSTFTAGLVTIVLNSTAYMMEVLRGGIESVDAGQMEAARSLGLSQWEAMRKVVFPQGVKFAIPGLSNELVINIKDSSVLSVIGTFDLMFATTTVGGIYYAKFEAALVTSVMYLCLTMFASWLLGRLASRLDVKSVKLGSTSDQPVNVEER